VAVSNPYKELGRYEGIHIELTDEMICRLFIGTVAVAEILRH
jgi:hypothetical protein